VLTITRDMVLPTTITGSYPRPLWFDRSLAGRSFKSALGDSLFREQYLDAVASIIAEQETAGLDIVTDGDSRFDLTVGGKSWFFYPIDMPATSRFPLPFGTLYSTNVTADRDTIRSSLTPCSGASARTARSFTRPCHIRHTLS
jgi:hypothetical protein